MARRFILPLASAVAITTAMLASCEKPIDVKLKDADPVLVFEGKITNEPGPYEFTITRTVSYFGSDPVPQVSGAFFTIQDDMGNLDTLVETSPGHYRTSHIQGQMMHQYTFTIQVEGETYTATDQMGRVSEIDTLVPYFQEEDVGFLERGWYIVLVAQEQEGEGDNYWFRFLRNDSLYADASDIWFTDDRFADGQLAIFQYPFKVETGDTIISEVYGFRNAYYDYLLTMVQQANSGGGPFGSPPDNVKGNMSNGALGFLAAIAVERDTVVVP